MKVGVVGCGLIGKRRARVVQDCLEDELTIVADTDSNATETVVQISGCEATNDWRKVITRKDVDAVIVATPHRWLAPVAISALREGKHVLLEKPMGVSLAQAREILDCVRDGIVLKIGFNHRHHPAIVRAHQLCWEGGIGRLLFARCRYGHGGRPGYDHEWRADPVQSGGGELLDQGIHAVDLFRWFFGDFHEAFGCIAGYIWTGRGVEDNGFGLFRTASGQIASLHASWNQWKNLFSFEVFGSQGYVVVEGLGGSYGTEQLVWGKRGLESGPPREEVFRYEGPDQSWKDEWMEFHSAIREQREPLGCGRDGVRALELVFALYESSRSRKAVRL